MNITEVKNTVIVDTRHKVDVRRLYDRDNAQVMHMTLKPGESLKPHITPVDVFFYVLEGRPTVQIGEEIIAVEKDCLVDSPKGIVHCLSNETNENARILVVKAPKPTAAGKLL